MNKTHTLNTDLNSWFNEAHSLQETVDTYKSYGQGAVFDKVILMEKEGALRRFSEKGTIMWIHAVSADKESDIGV